MRTHGAAARRGKSVGLARLRILGRPTASSASQPTSGPEKKKQDNKKRPVPALLPERAPLFCGFSHLRQSGSTVMVLLEHAQAGAHRGERGGAAHDVFAEAHVDMG